MLSRDWPFIASVVWTLILAGLLIYLVFLVG
jgi:hypothetical protein